MKHILPAMNALGLNAAVHWIWNLNSSGASEENSIDLNTPPAQDSPNNILNALDNYCIQTIFRHLNLSDFVNASEVCTRFHDNAIECFPLTHGTVSIFDSSNDFLVEAHGKEKFLSLKQQQILFKNFGHLIHGVEFGVYGEPTDENESQGHYFLCNSIIEFCGQTLMKLKIYGHGNQNNQNSCGAIFSFDDPKQFPALKELHLESILIVNLFLSSTLEKLTLHKIHSYFPNYYVDYSGWNGFYWRGPVRIYGMIGLNYFQQQKYPNLSHFEFALDPGFSNLGDSGCLLKFLELNPQIVHLETLGLLLNLKDIHDRTPHLERFVCHWFDVDLNNSNTFKNLKHFSALEITDEQLIWLTTNLPTLERMLLCWCKTLSAEKIAKAFKIGTNLKFRLHTV